MHDFTSEEKHLEHSRSTLRRTTENKRERNIYRAHLKYRSYTDHHIDNRKDYVSYIRRPAHQFRGRECGMKLNGNI